MHADFQPCVYIMASARHGTLYTGVTSHLIQRICQHRDGIFGGFTDRYGVKLLVWFEQAGTMHAAITREKQIKNWRRKWKIGLIEKANPDWRDLAEELGLPPLSSSRT
jgi:putative endonuclease